LGSTRTADGDLKLKEVKTKGLTGDSREKQFFLLYRTQKRGKRRSMEEGKEDRRGIEKQFETINNKAKGD